MNIHEHMRQIVNLMKSSINKDLDALGITFSQSGVLLFLCMNKDKKINQRHIEKEFNLTNPTVNGILNRLESNGFIKRLSDTNDRRIKNIVLLEKAEDFIELIKIKKDNLEHSMLKGINEKDLNIFNSVLKQISYNLKENSDES